MKACPKCGSPNDEALSKCARCGARLPRETEVDRAGRSDLPEPVASHMRLAVIAALLFIPFGLMAVVQAAQVKGWYQGGEYERPTAASLQAKRWALAGIVAALVIDPIIIIAAYYA